MRGLDTNVLVRYLAVDDAKQLAMVEELFDESERNREPLFLSAIMLCELVWVMAKRYNHSKLQILQMLDQILERDHFRIENDLMVRRSLESFRDGKGNFSDYLIAEVCRQNGCRDFVTLDRALKNSPGITALA